MVFSLSGGMLHDRGGHAVVFSIVTNAGNRSRERMATMIQQDLRSLGITVNVVTLDFPSLIQRISETFNYEAALLGLVNVELDPNAADECLAQFFRRTSVEPQAEDAGYRVGGRDRSPDARPGLHHG